MASLHMLLKASGAGKPVTLKGTCFNLTDTVITFLAVVLIDFVLAKSRSSAAFFAPAF
jgi:hypothetical protein